MKSSLLQSRKFWLMLADVVVSIATYFITKYANPELAKDMLFLIGALQPVVIAVIASITVQNVEHIKAAAWKDADTAIVKSTGTAQAEEAPQ